MRHRYAEFAALSNFSFLRGASHPEELIAAAARLGLRAFGLADINSVAGVVRAHVALREMPLPEPRPRFHPGARLVFRDGTPDMLAFPRDRAGWGRLCRLLTVGNRRAEKGECLLDLADLLKFSEGLELIVLPGGPAPMHDVLARLREAAPGRVRLGAVMHRRGDDRQRLAQLASLAHEARVSLIALGDVLYHAPERRPLQDVLACIREGTSIDRTGKLLEANAERHLKPPAEMTRLFRDAPEATEETLRLSERLNFSLDELKYEYPDESREGFATTQEALVHFTYEGAAVRYSAGIPEKIRRLLEHELALIAGLNYAPYFLTVHDIVRFARSREILCQGRGSAANSAVCYCLGITEVDPDRIDLLFERFVSAERREPPDIDVDFEHERREEVIQYVYGRYGRERAGLAASVITYRSRSAVREVGKALGFTVDVLDALAGNIWGWSSDDMVEADLRRAGLDVAAPRVVLLRRLANEIRGFPRHLSQHTGGFVITRGRLDEVVPIENAAMEDRTVVCWDKDDLDALGILKIDLLGLGMLTCIRKALDLVQRHYGAKGKLGLADIPAEDPAIYRMLQRADSLGVFQVESRAQMTMLPRLRPEKFYDLVIEVAIVRPGPIQGDMVHPYLRRRQGLEPVSFPSKNLEAVLGKTLGIPLFQEQAMKIAIVAAGFTPSEADRLRRAMATFRRVGTIGTFEKKMIDGMVARGYEREFAERCFHQIEGFGEYGFPESHAASFALLVYASAWLKCRYPDAFAAGLLNSQPMGFYSTSQIVRDAREHGVEVRPVDINFSGRDATLEPGPRAAERMHVLHASMRDDIRTTHALRLGLREIKGLSEEEGRIIEEKRKTSRYDSVRDLWLRTGLPAVTLVRLAEADAFGSLGLSRRDALWAAQALGRAGDKENLPLFAPFEAGPRWREPDVALPPMPPGEEVVHDYRTLRLSLKAHPVSFVRHELGRRGVVRNEALRETAHESRAAVAGLVLVRQRPGTAKGVLFLTLEDETSVANVIVWPKMFERYRAEVLGARLLMVRGRVQNEQGVIHVVAEHMADASALLATLAESPLPADYARADEGKRPNDRYDHRDKGALRPQLEKAIAGMPEPARDLDVPAPASRHKLPRGRRPRDPARPGGRNLRS
jgi:error-prone DNA polymerase